MGEYLNTFAKENDNVILLNNDENLGFVQTVNRGFSVSENHIALVNTDVELPNQWLERLMIPIFENKRDSFNDTIYKLVVQFAVSRSLESIIIYF